MDWQLSVLEISTMWLFNVEQIESMVNESIKGHKHPFSVTHRIAQKPDQPLDTKERNTLLIIIAALAKEAKIPLDKHDKAGKIIAGLTERLGAPVSDDAIASKIKLIPNALESRSR
jgi:hypothetical protein